MQSLLVVHGPLVTPLLAQDGGPLGPCTQEHVLPLLPHVEPCTTMLQLEATAQE